MTIFIDCGIIVHSIRDTIYSPDYRILKPRSIQVQEMAMCEAVPPDYVNFKYLCTEDGDSFYTHNTSIRRLFSISTFDSRQRGSPVKVYVDIRQVVLKVLNGYEQGFRNMWREWAGRDETYKSEGMKEMFKVISNEVENQIRA